MSAVVNERALALLSELTDTDTDKAGRALMAKKAAPMGLPVPTVTRNQISPSSPLIRSVGRRPFSP